MSPDLDLRPLLLRAANSLHDLTVGGEAAQLGDTSNLAADKEVEQGYLLAVLIRRTLGDDYCAAAGSAAPSTPGDRCGFCGALCDDVGADLAELPAAAAQLSARSPNARIVLVFGEPEPWRLADTEGRAIVRGRRLADILPPRTTTGPRAIVRAAGLLLAVALALVTACTAAPQAPDHGGELARVGADGRKPPGPIVALDRDRPAPIPPAPTPWDLYGAAALVGAAAGYSLVRLRRG